MTCSFNICLDAEREAALLQLSREQRQPVMKPTCAPDDGSDAGPWLTVPASEIDGDHPFTRSASAKEIENA